MSLLRFHSSLRSICNGVVICGFSLTCLLGYWKQHRDILSDMGNKQACTWKYYQRDGKRVD